MLWLTGPVGESLEVSAFNKLVDKWGQPAVDMFASRLNYKVRNYVAWKPDPSVSAIDAFTIDWANYDLIYCFPPFSLIGKVLQKIQVCQATAIVVVPRWRTQFWYPKLMKMLLQAPVQIPVTPSTLTLPQDPLLAHPLYPKLELIGCLLSGKCWWLKGLKVNQWKSFLIPGERVPRNNTQLISPTRLNTVVRTMWIKLNHLWPRFWGSSKNSRVLLDTVL